MASLNQLRQRFKPVIESKARDPHGYEPPRYPPEWNKPLRQASDLDGSGCKLYLERFSVQVIRGSWERPIVAVQPVSEARIMETMEIQFTSRVRLAKGDLVKVGFGDVFEVKEARISINEAAEYIAAWRHTVFVSSHLRGDGTKCPYMAEDLCNKCGWTKDMHVPAKDADLAKFKEMTPEQQLQYLRDNFGLK